MISSRHITDLHVSIRGKCEQFIIDCKAQEIDILITSTYRDDEMQTHLYASGRTRKGNILTNAKAGQSKHNKRMAFDFCVMQGGKCDWNNTELFTKAGLIGENLGLIWAGRWRGRIKEISHFEI